MKKTIIKKGLYFDSVKLMLVTNSILALEGVENVAVVMGTDLNKDSLKRNGLDTEEALKASKTDLIIGIDAVNQEILDKAFEEVKVQLDSRNKSSDASGFNPLSIKSAKNSNPDSNICIVSVPGEYAYNEAEEALKSGLNVMLFSDNMSVEEEIKLKDLAIKKDLLMMGPDCGTSNINGVPLCFSNVVKKGPIGIVGASGTGTQEVMTLIDKFGGGLSQVIGTGGRDLSEAVEGRMSIYAMQLLEKDPNTKTIVLISKPPKEKVIDKILDFINSNITKPVVINFIGHNKEHASKYIITSDLKETAIEAVKTIGLEVNEKEQGLDSVKLEPCSRVLGLYSGGTLAYETYYKLSQSINGLKSNLKENIDEEEILCGKSSLILDLGDDKFTQGRAHPMIDPTFRNEYFKKAINDKSASIIILDLVLGYGSNREPHKEIVKILRKSSEYRPHIFVNICGTKNDPQDYDSIKKELESVGVHVFESNIDLIKSVKNSLEG